MSFFLKHQQHLYLWHRRLHFSDKSKYAFDSFLFFSKTKIVRKRKPDKYKKNNQLSDIF